MKKYILTFAMTMLMMLGTITTFAQHGAGQGNNAPAQHHTPFGLTEDQSKKMQQLNDDAQKRTFQIDLQIKEKKAHLDILRYADKADINAINATIDEIARLKADKAKIREANIQEIRKMLTDDQRAKFDQMSRHKKHNGKRGPKHGDAPQHAGQHHGQQHASQSDCCKQGDKPADKKK